MKAFAKKNWNYIVAVIIPWVIVLVHLIITRIWYEGEGCILAGDAGDLYYPMYLELWEKVHKGGSLLFTWNAGIGTDFLVYIFRYMISPITLVILLLPKSCIAGALQLFMVLKWSLLGFTMMYYVMHTKHNKITEHRKLTGLLLTSAFCLSNAMIENAARIGWYDVLILFPVLLLLTEKVQEGKKKGMLWLCLTVCILCNFSMSVPLSIFLVVWYFIHSEKKISVKNAGAFLTGIVLAYMAAMVTVLPCIMLSNGNKQLYAWNNLPSYISKVLMPVTDFVHRWFICDYKGMGQENQPMLYCSVTIVVIALFYVFLKENIMRRVLVIVLTLLLAAGMINGGFNLVWHGYVGVDKETSGFSFLLVFMVIYMAMCVMGSLENLKKRYTFIVAVCGTACIAYAFLNVKILLDYYVYLITFLIFILTAIIMFFYCKGSIKHKNIYVVLAVFAFLELLVNANIRFLDYNAYSMDNLCYRRQNSVLINVLDLKPGERVAIPQDVANYNLICGLPAASGELAYADDSMRKLFGMTGLGWNEDSYVFSGASPLLNMMFNVKYGIGAGECAFSDTVEMGENNGVKVYSMNRLAGAGYMVKPSVSDWDISSGSPFELQNDYVNRSAGTDDIFKIIFPVGVRCDSVFPKDPGNRVASMGAATHGMEVKYGGLYDEETGYFTYDFVNGYYGENVMMKFTSDGVTDYYIHVKCGANVINSVVIDDQTVFSDAFPVKVRTYHIGVVEAGKVIQINSNAEVENDDMTIWRIEYQFAGFLEDNYNDAYEILSRDTYQVDKWEDTYISGSIDVKEAGIMASAVPAINGFTVYVDGKQTSYDKIGGALIGVPLEAGEHTVEFKYRTPYLTAGVIISVIGLLLAVIFFFIPYYKSNRQLKPENMAEE
ncbi:MAG: YfhO family protein [Lachnospiraceae bacterium]|nr:YfhO family protein [Lachnospiraceae bacterium]